MTTPARPDAVIERLDLGVSREDLLGRVQIRPLEQSGIVSIIAEAGSPEAAARLANTFAEVFIERRTTEFQSQLQARIDQVEAQLNQLGSESTDEQRLALLEKLATLKTSVGATDPTIQLLSEPVAGFSLRPRPVLTLAVAIFAALLLGVGECSCSRRSIHA